MLSGLPPLSPNRTIMVWLLAVFGLACAIFDYAAEMKVGFTFDMRCALRDFPNYYIAAQARALGLSPYDFTAIQDRFGVFVWWVYPEMLVHLFTPLTGVSMDLAGAIFTMIKVLVLGLAVLGWLRAFPQLKNDLLFAAFLFVGLNLTLFHDLCGGNVSVFEAAAIAWALAFLLQRRFAWFFVLIALAGMWKIVPLFLAALALVVYPRERAAWIGAIVLGAIGAFLLGLWWLVAPDDVARWWAHGRSTFVLRFNYFEGFKALFWQDIRAADLVRWYVRPEVYAFALLFLGVVTASFLAWRRSLAVEDESVRLWRLLFGAMTFIVVMPGAFLYSYVFALPLIYLPLRRGLAQEGPLSLLALLGMAVALTPTIPWSYLVPPAFAVYQPLFAGTIAWVVLLVLSKDGFSGFKIPAQSASNMVSRS